MYEYSDAAIIGTVFLGILYGIVGCFTYVRKESLLPDAVSHAAFPGIAAALLITGRGDFLLLGAAIFSIISVLFIKIVAEKSKIKTDAMLVICLSSFFGLGLILKSIAENKLLDTAPIDAFVFGDALSMNYSDVMLIALISLPIILASLVFLEPLKLVCFDKDYAQAIGVNSSLINFLFSVCVALSIIMGLKILGAILICSVLICPPVFARQCTDKFNHMLIISSVYSAALCVLGVLLGIIFPSAASGAVIVILLSAGVILKAFAAG